MAVLSTFHGSNKRPNLQEGEARYWPEEIIQEIIARLPVQSILRFKSVCKKWQSLIQSRAFIEFHRAHHLPNDHLDELFFSRNHRGESVVYTTTDEPYVISSLSISSILATGALQRQSRKLFDHLGQFRRGLTAERVSPPLYKMVVRPRSGALVLGPLTNGITCAVSYDYVGNSDSPKFWDYGKVALCNLATRQFNFIPFPFVREARRYETFDYDHFFGFCSIQSPQGVAIDYKIVLIEDNYMNGRVIASVYSQQQGSWRRVYEDTNFHSSSPLLSGCRITQNSIWMPVQALLHGHCHWMAINLNHSPKQHLILRFDMANDVFGVLPGPPGDEYYPLVQTGRDRLSNVFVLDGCIAVTVAIKNVETYEGIHVWRMMEYGVQASWMKVFSCEINLGSISRILGMSFSAKTNRLERLFFEQDFKHLMSTNGSKLQRHRTFKHFWACWKPLGLSSFMETLEPLSTSS